MKVAIIGTGSVARYLTDELLPHNHEVVTVSRSKKSWLDDLSIQQYAIQYTASEIAYAIKGCEAVICTVSSSSRELVQIHETLLAAINQTPTVKRLLPSVWVGNFEDVRDQPYNGAGNIQKIHELLTNQRTVEWTFISVGWLIDYVIPASQRYLPDGEGFWVQDAETKTFKFYGEGTQVISTVAARDAAAAAVRLLETDVAWEPFTYISGEQISWGDLWNLVKEYDPQYTKHRKTLSQSIEDLLQSKDDFAILSAAFDVMGFSEALRFPPERVTRHRELFFKGLRFRTIRELFEDAKGNPGKVV
ncbi:hypothetical protein ACHAQA_003934 [Verticillium albo-atrum]